MKPWGPSWLKLQTEFYPTGFLQARVRQSQERERESAREGVCVYTGRQAPPTLTVPGSLSKTQTELELQPCRNYLKLEAHGAEIKSERFFPLPFLPLHPEGKCLSGGGFACVCPCVALCWVWGEAAGAPVSWVLGLPGTGEGCEAVQGRGPLHCLRRWAEWTWPPPSSVCCPWTCENCQLRSEGWLSWWGQSV